MFDDESHYESPYWCPCLSNGLPEPMRGWDRPLNVWFGIFQYVFRDKITGCDTAAWITKVNPLWESERAVSYDESMDLYAQCRVTPRKHPEMGA